MTNIEYAPSQGSFFDAVWTCERMSSIAETQVTYLRRFCVLNLLGGLEQQLQAKAVSSSFAPIDDLERASLRSKPWGPNDALSNS